jgi:hypothetical protein
MDSSNAKKSRHGYNAQNDLENLLMHYKNQGYILNYKKNYKVGREGFTNKKQFYAPFILTFANKEQWILFSTTSLRTDRIKEQQWDSMNLKVINPNITKSLLVFSGSLIQEENDNFEKQRNKCRTKDYSFSSIDDIVNQDELNNLIEAKALHQHTVGKAKDIQGRNFEGRVALTLADKNNLAKWKTGDDTLVGIYYDIFARIMGAFLLEPSSVEMIYATTDSQEIGRLPSGGSPKTDVLVTVYFYDNTPKTYTISCKRTSAEAVSVHQYKAETFANVLDKDNDQLRGLLAAFQENPSLSGFGADNCKRLEQALKPYNKILTLWVLGGVGGEGDSEKHWASHLLTYDNNSGDFAIHSIHEYYDLLLKNSAAGHFGTFFSWTYASGARGKNIQLKCRII